MTDRDDAATTPLPAPGGSTTTAPTAELPREDAAARDPYAAHDPYAVTPPSNEPKKPFFRRTGVIIGLAAVALLLLGLIFGAGFAAGRVSANVFDRGGIGPGSSDGFGPGQNGGDMRGQRDGGSDGN